MTGHVFPARIPRSTQLHSDCRVALHVALRVACCIAQAEGDPPPEFPTNLDELRAA